MLVLAPDSAARGLARLDCAGNAQRVRSLYVGRYEEHRYRQSP